MLLWRRYWYNVKDGVKVVLTDRSLREKIRKALESQKPKTVTVLSSLLAVQDDVGYIPKEAVQETAIFTKKTINEVWGIASFYKNFHFSPPGKHVVEVCWGPACHIKGAMRSIKEIVETLGLRGEGDTADGEVSLRFNTCLGACAQGPVVSVDHNLIGRVSPERAQSLVEKLGFNNGSARG